MQRGNDAMMPIAVRLISTLSRSVVEAVVEKSVGGGGVGSKQTNRARTEADGRKERTFPPERGWKLNRSGSNSPEVMI